MWPPLHPQDVDMRTIMGLLQMLAAAKTKDHGSASVVLSAVHYTRLRARVSRTHARAIHLVQDASLASRLPCLFLLR